MSRISMCLTSVFVASMLFFACGSKLSEGELRKQAQDFERQEAYEDALKTYQQLLQEYPNSASADSTLQRIAFLNYNNLNNLDGAIEYHRRLIKEHPESALVSQARFMVGYIYANDVKDYDMAREAYKDFLEHHPESELAESVRWELEHLGQDVNSQLEKLFGDKSSNGKSR